MTMAMEPVANSKVLIDNPGMTFRTGSYVYEVRREGQGSIYKVTDGKEIVVLPVVYAFGQGIVKPNEVYPN